MTSSRATLIAALAPALLASMAVGRPDGSDWWEDACEHAHAGGLAPAGSPARSRRVEFDEDTGRSLLNFPPHRLVEHSSMRLEVTIPDMNTPTLTGVCTLGFVPIGRPLAQLTLNAGPEPSMHIASVTAAGNPRPKTTFKHDGEKLEVTFDPPISPGTEARIAIAYSLTDPAEGMIWTPESAAWPGRPAQLHTQGQPESNHYWFPCHDFPNERLATDVVATVPAGFVVCSNGVLVGRTPASGQQGLKPGTKYETFHWRQAKPHASYLVSLVVGKFDIVDVGSSSLPMPVYAPLGKGGLVKQSYGRTPEMIDLFSKLVDEPYPWDKYAQVIVWNFASGGMENTSATTMYDSAILDRAALQDGDLDGLISHELAHQWFGDLVTCTSWEHIWLNEGFATYFSHLWFEKRDGRDAYLSSIYDNFHALGANDHADAPFAAPMASKMYSHPWEAFRRPSNPYGKGSSILHMLRQKVGDELFFRALALYVDRFKEGSPDTDDLRYAFEEVSGLSLERFFNQWCKHPGVPNVDAVLDWDSGASTLNITLTQTQNIDGYNPAFFFTLPLWVKTPGGPRDGQWLEVEMDGRTAKAAFPLPQEPTVVAVDPNLSVLGKLTVTQPVQRWLNQLEAGPTIAARLQATAALQRIGEDPGSGGLPAEIVARLRALARDRQAFHTLRSAAVTALGKSGQAEVIAELAHSPLDDARVRRTVVEQVPAAYRELQPRADNAPARLLDDLRQAARREFSYGVRAAAVRALGELKLPEGKPVILEAAGADSQHDQVRQAALEALGALDDPEGLPIAVRLAQPGTYTRTRPTAIEAIAVLAHHDPELAYATVSGLLKDREARTVRAAGDALVKLADPRAIGLIEEFGNTARSDIARDLAKRWVNDLHEKLDGAKPDQGG